MEKFIVVTKDTESYFMSNGISVMQVDSVNGEINFMKPDTYKKVYWEAEKTVITKRRFVEEYHKAILIQQQFLMS